MQPWNTLSLAERTVMRRGLWQSQLAGTVEQYNIELRWAGRPGVPLRGLTDDEARALVPELAQVAAGLVDRGLLVVRMRKGEYAAPTDSALTEAELLEVLAEPDHWIRSPKPQLRFDLDATGTAREWWQASAYEGEVPDGLPAWEELTPEQQRILVCALEGSGMLTGPYGNFQDLPTELTGAELAAWLDDELAPLAEFVRQGWLEVRHFAVEGSEAYTAIPYDELRTAFADRTLRHDDGDDWGVGFTCVFTYAGLAVWRGSGWSASWGRKLTFD